MADTFTIANTTKSKLPRLLFKQMKEKVLGKSYELSLVFVTPKKMQQVNVVHRKKNKPTNILSFPLEKSVGEIYICLSYSKKEAHLFDRTYSNYIAFLFIHGLVHLKGFDHGSRMETEEQKIRQYFRI